MSDRPTTAVPGPDGELRCPWALAAPEYVAYHDDEWGRPSATTAAVRAAVPGGLPVRPVLADDPAQAGELPGRVRRVRHREVAAFGAEDVARLLADAGIVRNRAKIEAAIANARAALDLPDGLAALVWSTPADEQPRPGHPGRRARLHARVQGAVGRPAPHGFRFTGPVTAYATMQACGIVNDHLADCFCRAG